MSQGKLESREPERIAGDFVPRLSRLYEWQLNRTFLRCYHRGCPRCKGPASLPGAEGRRDGGARWPSPATHRAAHLRGHGA